jgi:hypothetical protein
MNMFTRIATYLNLKTKPCRDPDRDSHWDNVIARAVAARKIEWDEHDAEAVRVPDYEKLCNLLTMLDAMAHEDSSIAWCFNGGSAKLSGHMPGRNSGNRTYYAWNVRDIQLRLPNIHRTRFTTIEIDVLIVDNTLDDVAIADRHICTFTPSILGMDQKHEDYLTAPKFKWSHKTDKLISYLADNCDELFDKVDAVMMDRRTAAANESRKEQMKYVQLEQEFHDRFADDSSSSDQ